MVRRAPGQGADQNLERMLFSSRTFKAEALSSDSERMIFMVTGTAKITMYAPWVHSLKEKRMIVKSVCAKVRNKFNVSISEVEEQDTHQSIVLGLACVTGDAAFADSVIDHVLNFIEEITEAEIVDVKRELL